MFLIEKELTALSELRKAFNLPSFATNLTDTENDHENRILISLSDPEVNINFYINYKKSYENQFKTLINYL